MPDSPNSQAAQTLAGPGLNLILAARAVGLENHRQLLADAQKRTREGHLAMAQAAGMSEAVDMQDQGMSDDMGHLIVTGDINVQANKDGSMPRMPWDVDHEPQPSAPEPTQPQASAPTASTSRIPSWLKTTAVALGLPSIGAIALWAGQAGMDYFSSDPVSPPVAESPADGPTLDPGGLELEIIDVP